jgi:hypothetical protein
LFFVAVSFCNSVPGFGQNAEEFRPAAGVLNPKRFSDAQWEKLARGTIEAIGGGAISPEKTPEKTTEKTTIADQADDQEVGERVEWRERQVRALLQQNPEERLNAFRGLIDELLSREEYVRWYADGWMQEVGSEDAQLRCEIAGWDKCVYRKWLLDSIRNNDSFDSFLRRHFTGDERLRSDRRMIPTAAWYLAGHSAKYQVLEDPTAIEANLLRPFRESLVSIEEAEGRDWDRLKTSVALERWYRMVAGLPKPPPEELVGQWTMRDEPRNDSQKNISCIEQTSIALKAFREWSLVLEVLLEPQAIESDVPVVVFEQVNGSSEEVGREALRGTALMRVLRISMVDGHLQIGFIHDALASRVLVRTREALTPGAHQIVLVNEGTGNRQGVYVVVDGTSQSLESVEAESEKVSEEHGVQPVGTKGGESLCKEVSRGDRAVWRVAVGATNAIQTEQISAYRVALSVPECMGLSEVVIKPDWDDLDEVQKEQWRCHYARRHDAQWRYQRESRLYYLGSVQSIRESVAMLPMLHDSRGEVSMRSGVGFPTRWLPSMQQVEEAISVGNQRHSVVGMLTKLGMDLELQTLRPEAVERIALQEIERVWGSLMRRVGKNGNGVGMAFTQAWGLAEGHREDNGSSLRSMVVSPFAKSWDRRSMLRSILMSQAWFRALLGDDEAAAR